MNKLTPMPGWRRAATLLPAMVATAFATGALAQMRGGGTPAMPVGTSLDKIAVGTWAEYDVKRGADPARKLRQALVGKEGGGFVVETRGENGRGEKLLTRSVLEADPTKEGGVKKVIMQMGDADPMEMPVGGWRGGPGGPGGPGGGGPGAGAPAGGGAGDRGRERGGDRAGDDRPGGRRMGGRYLKPDAKHLLGKETVKVPAGAFPADHYRVDNPRGGTIDYWLAKDAGPFGVVKLQLERVAGPGEEGGKVTYELSAKGKGARPELTKPAKPFDPEVMRARFGGRGPGGGPGGGGPGGNPAPAAPPAAKP
jgi:hypothetical protein